MVRFGLTVVRHGETRYNKDKILQELEWVKGVDVAICYTFVSPPQFRVLLQTLSGGKSTPVRLRLDFQSVLELCDSYSHRLPGWKQFLGGQGVDEPLSATGFRQADAAGLFLSNVKFTHVFSSDLLRAKQTAAAILGKNRFCKDLEIKYDARLRERKYGVAEGKPLADLKAMAKDAGEQCPSFTPSGGETLDEVRERARDFFEFLCQLAVELEQKEHGKPDAPGRSSGTSGEQFVFPWTNHCSEAEPSSAGSGSSTVLDANILVVSHGAYMRNWIGYMVSDLNCTLPANLTKSQLSSVSPNTGVSHFIVKLENGNLLKPNIMCVCLNQDSHLVDVGAECVASKMF